MRNVQRATIGLVIAAAAMLAWWSRVPRQTAARTEASAPLSSSPPEVLVAPGRVEPVSEEIKVGADLPGTLASAPLEEGDRVRRGQVIAEIANEDYRARVESAAAEVKLREAELARIVNGPREEERLAAQALVTEAEAVLAHAKTERLRYRELFRTGDVSRSRVDTAEREYAVAEAKREAAREHHAFVNAAPREDERSRAQAAVAVAQSRLAEARAMLNRTRIKSPINGTVLRKHLHAGESITGFMPDPIYTLGDSSRLRVRAEIDERDVAGVHPGQAAWVTADAYGSQRFPGRVTRIGQILGKKSIRGDEPTQRVDQKILEALIDLDAGANLPIGLRVNCHIQIR